MDDDRLNIPELADDDDLDSIWPFVPFGFVRPVLPFGFVRPFVFAPPLVPAPFFRPVAVVRPLIFARPLAVAPLVTPAVWPFGRIVI